MREKEDGLLDEHRELHARMTRQPTVRDMTSSKMMLTGRKGAQSPHARPVRTSWEKALIIPTVVKRSLAAFRPQSVHGLEAASSLHP